MCISGRHGQVLLPVLASRQLPPLLHLPRNHMVQRRARANEQAAHLIQSLAAAADRRAAVVARHADRAAPQGVMSVVFTQEFRKLSLSSPSDGLLHMMSQDD